MVEDNVTDIQEAKLLRLSDQDKKDLTAYFLDSASAVGGLKAQSFEGSGGQVTAYDYVGICSAKDLAMLGRLHSKAVCSRRRVEAVRLQLEESEPGHRAWGVLALAYGHRGGVGLAKDDRGHCDDPALTALLRFTSAIETEAVRLWIETERARHLSAASTSKRLSGGSPMECIEAALRVDDTLFCLPPSAGALRETATRVMRNLELGPDGQERPRTAETAKEREALRLEHVERMTEARREARGWLVEAEHLYRVTHRDVLDDEAHWKEQRREMWAREAAGGR